MYKVKNGPSLQVKLCFMQVSFEDDFLGDFILAVFRVSHKSDVRSEVQ